MGKIYLIKCENDGFITYKIGKTSRNINTRINEFKTGNPGNFSLVYYYETKNYNKIEIILHKIYKNLKINGEWFNDKLDEESFKNNCIDIDNTIKMLKNLDNPFI